MLATYLDKFETVDFPGAQVLELGGKFGPDPFHGQAATFPEWSANFGIDFTRDSWGLTWRGRWLDETDDAVFPDPDNLENTADSIFYHDVQAFYQWSAATSTIGGRIAGR